MTFALINQDQSDDATADFYATHASQEEIDAARDEAALREAERKDEQAAFEEANNELMQKAGQQRPTEKTTTAGDPLHKALKRPDNLNAQPADVPDIKEVEGVESGEIPESKSSLPEKPDVQVAEMPDILGPLSEWTAKLPKNIIGATFNALEAFEGALFGDSLRDADNWLQEQMPEFTEGYKILRNSFKPDGEADEMTQMFAQFMLPFSAYMKAFGAAEKAAGITTATGETMTKVLSADVLTNMTAFDRHLDRFSTMVRDMGIQNPAIEYLASNGGTEAEERLKNAIDGLVIGIPAAAIVPAFRAIKALWHSAGEPAEAMIEKVPQIKFDMDAPNFGMPDVPKVLPDDSPLLKETLQINTPERATLRADILEKTLKNGVPVAEGSKPIAWVMGGGGASGKGTVINELKHSGIIDKNTVIIDADDIKRALPEYQKIIDAGDGRAAAIVYEESSLLSKQAVKQGVDNRFNLVLDKTFGNPEKGLAEVQALKDAGYDVRLIGVTVDTEIAGQRAIDRAQRTRRYVPMQSLIDAHKGFSAGFEDIIKHFDSAILFDNNGEQMKLIARKAGKKLDIRDEASYNKFIEKGVKANDGKEKTGRLDGQGGSSIDGPSEVRGSQKKEGSGGRGKSASNTGGVSGKGLGKKPDKGGAK